MRLRFSRAVRQRRAGARNHVTKPRVEALELRWLLSGNDALAQDYGQLPLSFQLNEGQTDPQVDFLSQGSGYTLFLTPGEAVLSLQQPPDPSGGSDQAGPASVLSMQLVGAGAAPQVMGQDLLPGTTNYLIGNDPSQWHTSIPNYGQVDEPNVYPGIDLVYGGSQQQLEYSFTVKAGADPGVIRMAFTGAQSATLDDQGNLVLQTAGGPVVEEAPVLYQESQGVRQTVSGRYVLEGSGQVGFAVGSYDPSLPLVIDPTLSYSTYLGGSSGSGAGYAIAVDGSGNAYVTGVTTATDFPTTNPAQAAYGGGFDAFVAKLNPAGNGLVYATYLGGSANEQGNGIAVDSAGDAYVTGGTESANFPTVNPVQAVLKGTQNGFAAKLNPAGNTLLYSTYLGGSGNDFGQYLTLDASGNAYVTGSTTSTNFPTVNPLQASLGGSGATNAFVTKLNPAGNALVYSTYLGGSGTDNGFNIALDGSGDAYVTGSTTSTNFPTVNPLQASLGGSGATNAFVAKLNPAGSRLIYSTYLGGSDNDAGRGIAVDAQGYAYVAGYTFSSNFPTVNALQPSQKGVESAFVAKLNPAGNALVYSTYLGGSYFAVGLGLVLRDTGNVYVNGYTGSTDFPTVNPVQSALGGANATNAFVTELSPDGSALVYSTYLGGSKLEESFGIALDSSGNVYVTGGTQSTDYPTVNPLQSALGSGGYSPFVFKLAANLAGSQTTLAASPANPSVYGQPVRFTATVASRAPGAGTPTGTVQFQIDGVNYGPPAALVNGTAISTAGALLPAGAHTITALYGGDSNDGGSTGTFTQTVNRAPLTITANDATKTYGQTAGFAATAFTAKGLVGGDTISGVTESSAGSPAAAAAGSYAIVAGTATFSAGLSSNYAITYASGTLAVNPVTATQLVVTGPPPSDVAVGAPFSLTVTAEDGAGTVATGFNSAITVVLASDPGGVVLGGTLTATAQNGVATFSELVLNQTGSGYILELSGGGLSAATGGIATTGTVTAASHQFYSAAEKQTFENLATIYAQRAARLSAIAATTPVPLNGPINALAAYDFDESQSFAAAANDPPDSDFTTVAPPQNATLPPVTAGSGITQAEADAFNALFAEQAQALGLAQAVSTALNRAQAAAVSPANTADQQMQLAAVAQFSQQLGAVATSEPGLEASVSAALQAGGVADVTVSAAGIQGLQSSGLPAAVVTALQELAASDSQLQGIQLQDIQAELVTQNPAATAGSLMATLTDPVFANEVQNAGGTLMATVLLSGHLSPASDTGVSSADGITGDAAPAFIGTAPFGTTVQVFAQSQVDSTPVLIGSTVTTDSGTWQVTAGHLGDGTYAISARFSGGASGFGQVTPLTQVVIDTAAPRITAATYNHKTGQVSVTFEDPLALDPASLANLAFFMARPVKGGKAGSLKMSAFQSTGTEVTFRVTQGRSHPTDIFLEIVSGGVRDVAGNALNGAFAGTFPSGGGQAGSNFLTELPVPVRKAVKPKKGAHKSRA